MTEMAEHDALAARFAALATRDAGDWADVRRRARRMQLRKAGLVLAAGLVAVVVAAPALGLHRTVVDWFDAEQAAEPVQIEFLQLGVMAPPNFDMDVVPNSARRVTTVRLSTGPTTLVVAPTTGGSVCYRWSGRSGPHCLERMDEYTVGDGREVARIGGGYDGLEANSPDAVNGELAKHMVTPEVVHGWLLEDDVERLVLEYEDGGSTEVPFVWVSEPIDAGFFMFEVPKENRTRARRATGLVGYDGEDEVVARERFRFFTSEMLGFGRHRAMRLPDGEVVHLHPSALAERARKIIDKPSADGKRRLTAWIVPRKDGFPCYVYYSGTWCPPTAFEPIPLGAGMGGGNRVVISGVVSDDVARYRLSYQDGAVEQVEPVEQVILHEIPPSHYPRGKRLERVDALAADGKLIAHRKVTTDFPGVYPCEKPVDQGYGVMACP
jgi:hypothetical protein